MPRLCHPVFGTLQALRARRLAAQLGEETAAGRAVLAEIEKANEAARANIEAALKAADAADAADAIDAAAHRAAQEAPRRMPGFVAMVLGALGGAAITAPLVLLGRAPSRPGPGREGAVRPRRRGGLAAGAC